MTVYANCEMWPVISWPDYSIYVTGLPNTVVVVRRQLVTNCYNFQLSSLVHLFIFVCTLCKRQMKKTNATLVKCWLYMSDNVAFSAYTMTVPPRWAFVMAHCPSFVSPSVHACVRPSTVLLEHLWNRSLVFYQTSQEWSMGGSLPKLFKRFGLVAKVCHSMKKQVFKMQFSNIFLSEITRHRAFIFGIQHHLEVLNQSNLQMIPF